MIFNNSMTQLQTNNKAFNEIDFEQLFRTFFTPLCQFARKYTNNLDSAKEIVHDVFITLWEKRQGIDPDKQIKSYLFTSVYNRSLNYIRDNKKFDKNIELSELSKTIDESNSIEAKMDSVVLNARIQQALQKLPEKCREIFILSRFKELKYAEIAKKLNISVKTVEAQMTKALKILREELKDCRPLLIWFLCINYLVL